MATPGLLPEGDERRLSPLAWLPWLISAALLGLLLWTRAQVNALRRERDKLLAETLKSPVLPPKADASRLVALEAELEKLRAAPAPAPSPAEAAAPARPPDPRVLPPEQGAERLTQGLHEFRSGRYERAEAFFFRAIPEGYLYLALSCWARGELGEAALFLARAMNADPQWLRRVRPRDLFGNPADYERALRELEARVRENPLDVDAKTVLAYLHYHEKGAEYAKALLTELVGAHPDAPAPKAFLEAVDRP